MKACNFGKVYPKVCAVWSVVINYEAHKEERIWLVWFLNKFHVDVIRMTDQYIHIKAHHRVYDKKFHMIVVYGTNDVKKIEGDCGMG